MEVSSPALAGRAGLSPHPRGGLSCVALLKRTVSSDKQFHPRLRKLKRKLGQTPSFWQSFLLRDGGRRGQNKTWCDEGQFISSFTTAPDRKLVLPAGGRMRRRRDVSQFWWLWAAAREQMFGSKPSIWAPYSILFMLIPDAHMTTQESSSLEDSVEGRNRVSALLFHGETLGWHSSFSLLLHKLTKRNI